MDADLQSLYQEVILDHNKRPRNFRIIDPASAKARGHNPLCGDQIQVYLTLEDNVIKDVAFQGNGCAISTASASMMTEILVNKTIAEADQLFHLFHDAITLDDAQTEGLGKLSILLGVKNYPSRVKCATLAWHAMQSAIHNEAEIVKTE